MLLAIVPLFHAIAWGLPYAAFLTGASLLMPDRFLQAAPLADDDRRRAAHRAPAAVPTIWTDLLAHLDAQADRHAGRPVDHGPVDRRRLGLPAGADAARSTSGTASRSSTPGA